MTARGITDRLGGLTFGGDYDPEQGDEPVWREDDELMRRARVDLTTPGVFSWALLEPEQGRHDFTWLDVHIERLHANGVAVDPPVSCTAVATPAASPSPAYRSAARARHGSPEAPTRLDDAGHAALVGRLLKEAGVEPELPDLPTGVAAVTRHAADGRRRHVLINHTDDAVPLPDPAHDLLTGREAHELPPGACAVLRGR